MPSRARPYAFYGLLLVVAVGLPGCGATERVDQDTVRYTPRAAGTVLMLLGGLGVTALGGVMVFFHHRSAAQRRPRKSAKGPRREEKTGVSMAGPRAWGILLGGLVLLLGGVPGMLFSHVTVTPDEVIINESPFWFAPNRATVRFADVRDISTETEEKWGRRGKRTEEYILFHLKDGSTERVKAGPLVRAAQDRITAGVQAAQAGKPAGAGGAVAASTLNPAAQPGADTRPAGGGGPIDVKTLRPGMRLEALSGTLWLPVEVLAVEPNGWVRVHWVGYGENWDEALPPDRLRMPASAAPAEGGGPITAETPLRPGMKLEAHWGNNWYPVEVVEVRADGRVKVHYVGYDKVSDEVVTRDRLRFPVKQ